MLYTVAFLQETLGLKESALVCLAGAGIPMALLAHIVKRDKRGNDVDGS